MEEAWQREHEASLAAWKLADRVFFCTKESRENVKSYLYDLESGHKASERLSSVMYFLLKVPESSSSTTNGEPRVHISEPVGISLT